MSKVAPSSAHCVVEILARAPEALTELRATAASTCGIEPKHGGSSKCRPRERSCYRSHARPLQIAMDHRCAESKTRARAWTRTVQARSALIREQPWRPLFPGTLHAAATGYHFYLILSKHNYGGTSEWLVL